jgi:hypothetical protein
VVAGQELSCGAVPGNAGMAEAYKKTETAGKQDQVVEKKCDRAFADTFSAKSVF